VLLIAVHLPLPSKILFFNFLTAVCGGIAYPEVPIDDGEFEAASLKT